MFSLGLILSFLMGLALGMLGGGGSILTVPILIYVFGLPTKSALATSLFVVGTTSLVGVLQHGRAGNVRWRTGLLFGAVAMGGAFGGGHLAAYVPGPVLILLFAAMMLATALAMLRPAAAVRTAGESGRREAPLAAVIATGLLVGTFTGLIGAGGGFLIVPALVVLMGLDMRAAVGTSLLVIVLNSFAGFAGYLSHARIDLALASVVAVAAVGGSMLGVRLACRVAQPALRRGFAWFVLAMGLVMLAQQASPARIAALAAGGWPLGLAAAGLAAFLIWRRSQRRSPLAS